MMVMRQPLSVVAAVEAAKRAHVERMVAAAAARHPVEGALRVWVVALSAEGRWLGPEVHLTCPTMEEAEAAAAEVEARPGQWWAVVVDGREVGR